MAHEIRACRDRELGAVIALASRVFREGGGDMGADYPLMFCPENVNGLRIALDQGVPVALVGVCIRDAVVLGAPVRVASIGAVGTEPACRGQGLASLLMEDARQYARDRGASLMLISGGRGLYHRLGYVTVGRFDRYQWKRERLAPLQRPGIELSRYQDTDLSDLVELHQREPVRFLRSYRDWQRLLATGNLMNRPSELWLARQEGRAAAYMGVATAAGRGRPPASVLRINEFAGSRTVLAAALPALLDALGAEEVALVTQAGDVEFSAIAREHGWLPETIPFPGTLGVIDAATLLGAIRPLLSERASVELVVSEDVDGFTLSLDEEQYRITTPGPLAVLLFGGDTDEARAIPQASGRLGERLRRLFPIPLLWQGYNYV